MSISQEPAGPDPAAEETVEDYPEDAAAEADAGPDGKPSNGTAPADAPKPPGVNSANATANATAGANSSSPSPSPSPSPKPSDAAPASSKPADAGPGGATSGDGSKGLVLAVTMEGPCDKVKQVELAASVRGKEGLLNPSLGTVPQMVAKGDIKPAEEATCKPVQVGGGVGRHCSGVGMLDGTGGGMQGAVLVVAGLHLEESMHDLLGLFEMTGSNRTNMAIHFTCECVRHSLPFVASLHVHLFH